MTRTLLCLLAACSLLLVGCGSSGGSGAGDGNAVHVDKTKSK